ncbi:hypothetical protein ANTRET_LOCUS6927, partial [Anthophora retusa]
MSEKNGTGEFYLDDLSDCSDSYSGSDSGDESDGSDIIIRKRDSVLPLRCSDSEDDEISNIEDDTNNIEDDDDIWSTEDKAIILEPFEGSPGIKIMPSSTENVMDSVNLFIGIDFFEHLDGQGEININIKTPKENKSIKLQQAMYVPEFKSNLLSMSSITSNGYSVVFHQNHAIVKRKDGSCNPYKEVNILVHRPNIRSPN